MDWQPIETAPRDGVFLILLPDGRRGIAFSEPREYEGVKFYNTGAAIVGPDPYHDGRNSLAMSNAYLKIATHWMPLPPPPGEAP